MTYSKITISETRYNVRQTNPKKPLTNLIKFMAQKYIPFMEEMQDGRRKLTSNQKDEIRLRHVQEELSWSNLASQYNVSKRTIGFIVNPEVRERNRQYNRGRWKLYYSKEKAREAQRKIRAKKKLLKKEAN